MVNEALLLALSEEVEQVVSDILPVDLEDDYLVYLKLHLLNPMLFSSHEVAEQHQVLVVQTVSAAMAAVQMVEMVCQRVEQVIFSIQELVDEDDS